jgi:hypothetical protein
LRRAISLLTFACASACALVPAQALAGTFDWQGNYRADPGATAYVDFESPPERYLPPDADMSCIDPMYQLGQAADAIDGTGFLKLHITGNCAERFLFALPPAQASYRASVWTRHGSLSARIILEYADGSNVDRTVVAMGPTGRSTSDGWIELASNDFPVDGGKLARSFLRVVDYADTDSVQVDALEIVPSGAFIAQKDCKGIADPACSTEETCIDNRCVLGRLSVPPLPADAIRNDVVDELEAKVRLFYGGRRSRQLYVPSAMQAMEGMRSASTAFQFWNAWATGIHRLHDWHTDSRGGPGATRSSNHRLNACFFEGDADASHGIWPKDAKYADILVSHIGQDSGGLNPGDRLVAVDGVHPMVWTASLASVNWGYHVATDPDNFADHAEALGGPSWTGGALIQRYATSFTVIRCAAATGLCGLPETFQVADLPAGTGGPDVACDNRPFYHLDAPNSPDPTKHYVFDGFYRGPVSGTKPDEGIYTLVWDTLYGGGDPNSDVNKHIGESIADFEANAHGVILDHRAGNGGTFDSVKLFLALVRSPETAILTRIPIEVAGVGGPADNAAGIAAFQKFQFVNGLTVGSVDYDPALPVALILHRDGSCSDYMPFLMSGSPNVRTFGPHQTAGAFSTYIEFSGWGDFGFQLGSGDDITPQGDLLIGHGYVPDEVILPRQTDLLAGKDTLFEAALAWVRKGLKP